MNVRDKGYILLAALGLCVAVAASYGLGYFNLHYPRWSAASRSMEPTIAEGAWVFARGSKSDCGHVRPIPGDVVVHQAQGTHFIRRVVAAPGDKVEIRSGRLVLNDKPVRLERSDARRADGGVIYRETLPNGRSYDILDTMQDSIGDTFGPATVPAGQWFAMGDNRDNAADSRFDGPVPQRSVCAILLRPLKHKAADRQGGVA